MPKRTEIIKRIGTAAKAAGMKFEIKREGANHTIYSLDGLTIAVGQRVWPTVRGDGLQAVRAQARDGVVEMMKTYHANASRDGRFWLVHIPEIGQYTQGRNLAEVEPMARDLIALWLEIPADTFHVEVHVELPKDVRHHLELAAKYAADSAHAQAEAARERRIAARELKAKGLTVRDIGAALGISYQRAQQLVSA